MGLLDYHIIAFGGGFLLDLLLGDPYCFPHPVRAMGSLIGSLDRKYLGEKKGIDPGKSTGEAKEKDSDREGVLKRRQGRWTVFLVLMITGIVTAAVLAAGYLLHPVIGVVIETVMTYQALAAKCLYVESMKVYRKLSNGTLEEARSSVAMIVGRDTDTLDEEGVAKAAVETVAENASDGVIAPMLYLAIGGPILGFLYKAVNTMDSMIGYKNERYLHFGRAAAKLDDIVNFLPSRISAILMILSCFFLGKRVSASDAFRIFRRDRLNHSSPNSAQTESVCAGALGIRLGGDTKYGGRMVPKPFIGDPIREIEKEDIPRSNALMYGGAVLAELLCLGLMLGLRILCAGQMRIN